MLVDKTGGTTASQTVVSMEEWLVELMPLWKA